MVINFEDILVPQPKWISQPPGLSKIRVKKTPGIGGGFVDDIGNIFEAPKGKNTALLVEGIWIWTHTSNKEAE